MITILAAKGWRSVSVLHIILGAALCGILSPIQMVLAQKPAGYSYAPEGHEALQLRGPRGLRIMIKSEARCSLSDMDAISLEMTRIAEERSDSEQTQVLLTIEPLSEGGFDPVVKSISDSEIDPHHGVEITLPPLSKPVLAGVFVCTAEVQPGSPRSCKNKPSMDYDKILQQYRVEMDYKTGAARKAPRKGLVQDKIFFFRYLIIDGDSIYFQPKGMTDGRYQTLEQSLKKMGVKANDYASALNAAKQHGILSSVPLKLEGNSIIVNLPHYDPVKCGL